MIDDLRTRIDRIDEKLIELMNHRAKIAIEIGRFKAKNDLSVTDEEREKDVLNRVKETNEGPFSDEQLERIYGQLIEETKKIQVEVDRNDRRNET